MKFSSLAVALVAIGLLPGNSSADTIATQDWHLTTDSLGGLRQSSYDPSVWFAVGQSNVWEKGDTYEAPVGFRWATTLEGIAIFGTNNGQSGEEYVYFNQGGWANYFWEGKQRYYFRFSDSDSTNASKHVGQFDSHQLFYDSGTSNFAGIVLIQNIPEPSSLLFAIGSVWGLVLVRRRKNIRP